MEKKQFFELEAQFMLELKEVYKEMAEYLERVNTRPNAVSKGMFKDVKYEANEDYVEYFTGTQGGLHGIGVDGQELEIDFDTDSIFGEPHNYSSAINYVSIRPLHGRKKFEMSNINLSFVQHITVILGMLTSFLDKGREDNGDPEVYY